ncbi:MAG TPA: DUF1015 family protein [Candidatus Paceibacterota bacterium]|nr:DUF1015 domain-containing protein [Verrucomicrobiota bacterium]HOX02759.1 DUF1015 family protein [Verrucomicrobiota bacterium]HRZ44654.1 DUF1015 family protein [Candidatus Paceibacterota bacterium]HRZ92170.1 DUF1015 family protein [Candidatus Paceibacterota bacterium]
MARVRPFRAVRPRADIAAEICDLPYDVMSADEARQMAEGRPWSFLRVSRPEIGFAGRVDPGSELVYKSAAEQFRRMLKEGVLYRDDRACYYLYRQVMGQHQQVGWVGLASCNDYLEGVIKRHELTRPDKEADRMRHLESVGAQTGPAFLIHPADSGLRSIARKRLETGPAANFVAADGVGHSAWVISDEEEIGEVERAFRRMPALYIADGHHRSAAAVGIYRKRGMAAEAGGFLSVIFPDDQVRILPYHRVVKDLNGLTVDGFMGRLEGAAEVSRGGSPVPAGRGEVSIYAGGTWWRMRWRDSSGEGSDAVEGLDVSRLQQQVLAPVLGIADPRTSDRIGFIGGIRGTGELERLVDRGEYAAAFSMHPTEVKQLMAVADAGGVMPPKSTWFEPKLRDGMFCHLYE